MKVVLSLKYYYNRKICVKNISQKYGLETSSGPFLKNFLRRGISAILHAHFDKFDSFALTTAL